MNSISGEFESGTIVPLLTKPVSRTMVFLGKLFAAFIIILVTYTVLFTYTVIGGTVVYGAQNNLHLVPLTLLGDLLSTFVWIAIVLAIASISKSSLIAAIGGLGIFLALLISAPIVSAFSSQAWVLTYVPGSGASGTLGAAGPINATVMQSVATGTDGIGANLGTFVLHPDANVTFYRLGIIAPGTPPTMIALYTEPLSLVLARSTVVAFVYVAVFLFVAWFFFRRAQVLE
jgi:ABC-type transport system involved in multi-copper enzyme maturation permease subunit